MRRLALLAGFVGVLACGRDQPAQARPSNLAHAPTPAPATGAPNLASRLAELDTLIEAEVRRGEVPHSGYSPWASAARSSMNRAKLSGALEDYLRADTLLQRAFAVQPGVGPWRQQARLDAALHRFGDVPASLERAKATALTRPQRAELQRQWADLAAAQGDYGRARNGYEAALELDEESSAQRALAMLEFRTGSFDAAQRRLRASLDPRRASDRYTDAWTRVMIGVIDFERGRLESAATQYRRALVDLPGYPLALEHLAETSARLGNTADAIALYRDALFVAQQPEYLDALAVLLSNQGSPAPSASALADAERVLARWQQHYPAAAWGHAAHHWLIAGHPERALAAARANRSNRGSGDALVLLAKTLLATGNVAGAVEVIDELVKTQWRSVNADRVAAEVYGAAGHLEQRDHYLARAREIDPSLPTSLADY